MTDRPDLNALEAAHAKADKHGWAVDEDGDLVARVPTCWREGAWQTNEGRANAAAIVALHNAFPAHLAYTRALEAEWAAYADLTSANPAPRWFGHCFKEKDFLFA